MPNKTLYIKEADLPLFEQAQQQLGDSVSAMFADFLRERLSNMTPEEGRIIELLDQASGQREAVGRERNLPRFLESAYGEAESFAGKALKSLRRGEVKRAKIYFYVANSYKELADRDVKECREIGAKLVAMQAS